MDDSNSPAIGLDLNPDMMTTQTGIPSLAPKLPPLPPTGVIDITPGASESPVLSPPPQHIDLAPLPEHKVIDITPEGPFVPLAGATENAAAESVVLQTDSNIFSSQSHLSDILPKPQTQTLSDFPDTSKPLSEIMKEVAPVIPSPDLEAPAPTPIPQSPPQDVSPAAISEVIPETAPLIIDPFPAIPTPETDMDSVTPSIPEPSPPAGESDVILNPLYEDPDLVKSKS